MLEALSPLAVIQLSLQERYAEALLRLMNAERRIGPFGDTASVSDLRAAAEKARVDARIASPYACRATAA